jgi:ribosome-associated protein
MIKKTNKNSTLLKSIIQSIEDIKGQEIISLDFKKLENRMCSHFIVCSGTSNTHVKAISDTIKKNISKDLKVKPWKTEGEFAAEWVLIDYSEIIVHIFQKQTRDFYKLEELWADAKSKKYN